MGMLKEYYFQPGAPDPRLSDAEALRCVRRFVPQARAITGVDESGGEARTYLVDDDLVLKVQRPQQVRVGTSLAKEAFYLRQLAAHDPAVPVPRVLGHARETNLLEYNIQTRIPGVAFASTGLLPEARHRVIFDIGRLLRRLHALPQKPFHDSAHFPADHSGLEFRTRLGAYFDVVAARLEQTGGTWPPALIALEAVKEQTLAALPDTQALVALHANPGPPHTFVDPQAGTLMGLIDFGDSYISHPALDLSRWRLPGDRAAVMAGYTADEPVSEAFLRIWKCAGIVSDAVLIAFLPGHAAEAAQDVQDSLTTL
jgi:aminoglycoside phosphotransferase (APT) family kinase protein